MTTKCDRCGVEYGIGDYPFCKGGHLRGHGHGDFRPFDCEIQGMGSFHVDSIQKLRKLEDESHRRYANGEKVAPTVFRQYSQNSSNWDRNTLGRGPAPEMNERQHHEEQQRGAELRRHIASVRGGR